MAIERDDWGEIIKQKCTHCKEMKDDGDNWLCWPSPTTQNWKGVTKWICVECA